MGDRIILELLRNPNDKNMFSPSFESCYIKCQLFSFNFVLGRLDCLIAHIIKEYCCRLCLLSEAKISVFKRLRASERWVLVLILLSYTRDRRLKRLLLKVQIC